MALRVIWSRAALEDLEFAAGYIARDSNRYASAFVWKAIEAAKSLNMLAMRGRVVPEIGNSSIRELFVCNYRVIYQMSVADDAVYILGFIHGARDLWSLWEKKRL